MYICHDPTILLLGVHLRDRHAYAPRYMYQNVDSSIIIIAKNWKQPKHNVETKIQITKECILYYSFHIKLKNKENYFI